MSKEVNTDFSQEQGVASCFLESQGWDQCTQPPPPHPRPP